MKLWHASRSKYSQFAHHCIVCQRVALQAGWCVSRYDEAAAAATTAVIQLASEAGDHQPLNSDIMDDSGTRTAAAVVQSTDPSNRHPLVSIGYLHGQVGLFHMV